MRHILLLLLVSLNAYSMDLIPLTIAHHDSALRLHLSSPIGVPAKSCATVGKVNRKALNSDSLTIAVFVIGADSDSVSWLEQHQEKLKSLQAIGFITNVDDFERIIALQERFKLPLLPVNVDPLLNFIQEQHYPLIIAEGAVWQ